MCIYRTHTHKNLCLSLSLSVSLSLCLSVSLSLSLSVSLSVSLCLCLSLSLSLCLAPSIQELDGSPVSLSPCVDRFVSMTPKMVERLPIAIHVRPERREIRGARRPSGGFGRTGRRAHPIRKNIFTIFDSWFPHSLRATPKRCSFWMIRGGNSLVPQEGGRGVSFFASFSTNLYIRVTKSILLK